MKAITAIVAFSAIVMLTGCCMFKSPCAKPCAAPCPAPCAMPAPCKTIEK